MDDMSQATLTFLIKLGLGVLIVFAAGYMFLTNQLEAFSDQKQVDELRGFVQEIKYDYLSNEEKSLVAYPTRGIVYVKETAPDDRVRLEGYCGQHCLCAYRLNKEFRDRSVGECHAKGTIKPTLEEDKNSARDLLNSKDATILSCVNIKEEIETKTFKPETFKLTRFESGWRGGEEIGDDAWGLPLSEESPDFEIIALLDCTAVVTYKVRLQNNEIDIQVLEPKLISK